MGKPCLEAPGVGHGRGEFHGELLLGLLGNLEVRTLLELSWLSLGFRIQDLGFRV